MATGSSQFAKKNAGVKQAVKERKAAEARRTPAQSRSPRRVSDSQARSLGIPF